MAAPDHPSQPTLADRLVRPFIRFAELETSSALLLLSMAVIALVWANSPFAASYEHFWHTPVGIRVGEVFTLEMGLGHWVNDGLMAIFFFVVGMEIKREIVLGELSTRSRAMLPILGAVGGMVVPAGIYAAFHLGEPTLRGWGIPMATDIAFAVAALSVLGSRVPPGLRVFLLALAIADDLGAVTVIALFYTAEIHLSSLGLAGLGLVGCFVLRMAGVRSYVVYVALGTFVWYQTHHSGVHATIAGVMLGLLAPSSPQPADYASLLERGRHSLEHLRDLLFGEHDQNPDYGGHQRTHALRDLAVAGRSTLSPLDFLVNLLERPVAFFIMPVFALANAGVPLDATMFADPVAQNVAVAVALGLVVGKPLGITLFAWVSVRLGIAVLPRGVNWACISATGLLAGIGFTVALFVTALAFADPVATAGSKVGILVGSAVATLAGVGLLAKALPPAGGDEAG